VTTYVALLRGVNVGGRTVRMEDLVRLFQSLGHADAKSYIQSGNVVFTSAVDNPSALVGDLQDAIARDLGLAVTVVLRTGDELARVVAANPFLAPVPDVAKLYVTFLAEEPEPGRVAGLAAAVEDEPEELSVGGREVYLHYPNGYGRSKVSNALIERRLGLAATTRNWRTATKLADLARR
jgi:uncharacterized protein (DUF1697 family)